MTTSHPQARSHPPATRSFWTGSEQRSQLIFSTCTLTARSTHSYSVLLQLWHWAWGACLRSFPGDGPASTTVSFRTIHRNYALRFFRHSSSTEWPFWPWSWPFGGNRFAFRVLTVQLWPTFRRRTSWRCGPALCCLLSFSCVHGRNLHSSISSPWPWIRDGLYLPVRLFKRSFVWIGFGFGRWHFGAPALKQPTSYGPSTTVFSSSHARSPTYRAAFGFYKTLSLPFFAIKTAAILRVKTRQGQRTGGPRRPTTGFTGPPRHDCKIESLWFSERQII